MLPGFGFSVGDFLAVLRLVGAVIDALRESPYASSWIRSLINELYALESALLHVKRLDPDVGHNVEKVALQQIATQCQLTIDAFYMKIQKDQPHLQQGGTNSKIKDAWVKIKWTVCNRDDLEKFRAEIRGHTSSITILLLALQTRRQDSQQKGLASRIQDFSSQVMCTLSTITNSCAQSVQQGKELLESSAQIVHTSLRIFQIVYDIQLFILRIPGQIQRQQPVYLIDPFNKESPFHLEFVRSPEALLAILKINLKESGCGPAMIDRGEFSIEELGTGHRINLTTPWDVCFYPGQRVAMSMVFKQQQTDVKSSCPSCGTGHQEVKGKAITCITCGVIFRHIKESFEATPATSPISHSSDEGLVGRPERPPKTSKREENSTSTNVRKFRRIQLVGKKIVFNPTSMSSSGYQALLDVGVDTNAPPPKAYGSTALHAAAQMGNIGIVQILLDAGIDVNASVAKTSGATPLQAAATRGHVRTATLPPDARASVNGIRAPFHGRTALELAAEHGRLDMVHLLLEAGADGDMQYRNAVQLASDNGHYCVGRLIETKYESDIAILQGN